MSSIGNWRSIGGETERTNLQLVQTICAIREIMIITSRTCHRRAHRVHPGDFLIQIACAVRMVRGTERGNP
jgi:hypothetical protein